MLRVGRPFTQEDLIAALTLEEEEDGFLTARIETEFGAIRFLADLRLEGDTLTIERLDVEGPGLLAAGGAFVTLTRRLMDHLGRFYDVEHIVVQGSRRTTGARIGRIPAPIRFRVRSG